MELRHLESFVAVAEELHFGRAAERLHMAQPPLSQQIRLLERDLGARLFDRSTRSVRLTLAGESLLEPARDVLAAASIARRAVRATASGDVGRVSIGFAGASSLSALPILTRAVNSRHPGIDLVLRGQTYSGEALGQIAAGDLDVGFVALTEKPGLSMRVVRNEQLIVALPAEHRLADADVVDIHDLAQDSFVGFPTAHRSAIADAGAEICEKAGFHPRIVQEAPDAYNLVTLVAAGVGVALVADSSRQIQLEHVRYKKLAANTVTLPIALAWRTDNESRALSLVLAVAEEVLPSPD